MAASRGSTGQTAALAAVGLAAWCVWELTRQDVEHFDAPEDGGVLFDRDELVNEEEEPEEEEPGEEEPGEEEPEEEEPGGQTALAPVIVSDANVSRSGTNSGVSTGSVYRGKDLNFSCPGGYVVAQRPRGMPACNPAQQWRDTGFSLTADGPVLGMQECVRCVGNTFALVAGAPINTTPLPLATTTPLPLATMTPLPLATTTPLPLPVLFFHPPVAQQAPAPPSAFFAQLRPIVPTQPPTRPPGPIRTPGPAPSFRTRPNTLRPAALKKPVQVLPMKPAVLKPVIPPPPPNKKPLTGRPRPAPVSRPAPPQPKPQPPQPAGPAPGMTLLTPGSKALNAKGSRLASVVTKSGKQAYEVTYKKGVRGPKGSTGGFNIEPSAFFPAEQVRFRFKIWFDDSFPWGPEMKKVGGKIIGLKIGTGDSSGGNYSATGASYRLTWSLNGGVGPYLYPQVRGSYSKGGHGGNNIGWPQLDQSPEVQSLSYVAAGVHMFYPKDKKNPAAWDLKMHKGQWNQVEMFCKLNTPGKYDGVMEITVNGATKRVNSVRYRNDTAKIEAVLLSTFFGGGTQDYAPLTDTKTWYSDFEFSKA